MSSKLDCTASQPKTRACTASLDKIYLIGSITHQIYGAKLPSNRQVLQVFFFNLRLVKLTTRESAKLAISEALIFWQKARIPTRYEARCIDKLVRLYETWRNMQKTAIDKKSQKELGIQQQFIDSLDDLFDISHANALEMMRIDEDRQFLINQRQKGRQGSLIGVDMALLGKEQRKIERIEKERARKRKYDEMLKDIDTQPQPFEISDREEASDDESAELVLLTNEFESSDVETSQCDFGNASSSKVLPRGRKQFITPRLAAAHCDE